MADGFCPECGERAFVTALHGDKGGPEMCWKCGGAWHAKHARRRKAGRIVIKALKVFFDVGGKYTHVNALRLAASGLAVSADYGDTIGVEVGDITTELLDDTLQLVHPDRHPPERKETATRVTQELLALRPFVFPAPALKPVVPTLPRDTSLNVAADGLEKALREASKYPCVDCANEVPYFYCADCRAKWEALNRQEQEARNLKQRIQYATRKAMREAFMEPSKCANCNCEFKSKRRDAKYCSAACRQRAHRQRVTDNKWTQPEPLSNRDNMAIGRKSSAGRYSGTF